MSRLKANVTWLALATAALVSFPGLLHAEPAAAGDLGQVQATPSPASVNRQLRAFYDVRDGKPVWFSAGFLTPDAKRVIALFESARIDGLNPRDYELDALRTALDRAAGGSAREVTRADMLLSRTLLAYVRDLHRVPDVGVTFIDDAVAPADPTAEAVLAAAAAGEPLDQVLQMHPLYVDLRARYQEWMQRWGTLPDVQIPSGPPLSARSKGDRVRLLRERLGLQSGTAFDSPLAAAVQAFKAEYGLPATAVVDSRTLALLNQPVREQEARIRINLARARVLPGPTMGRYILVDAAAQRLWLYDGDRVVDSMKVIVGKRSEPTPMLAALIRYAAVNPYWNVPPDLVSTKIAPDVLSHGLGALDAKGYQVLSGWSEDAHPIDPSTVDWKAVAAGQEIAVRQLPGPANMMGTIKFMFPNKFGVYLHDTPDKYLFDGSDRRKSSGCVRLEDAKRLAKWLFGEVPTAPESVAEAHVPLAKPVPVYITYLTAAPDGSGIAFRDDVYGRDRAEAVRLATAD